MRGRPSEVPNTTAVPTVVPRDSSHLYSRKKSRPENENAGPRQNLDHGKALSLNMQLTNTAGPEKRKEAQVGKNKKKTILTPQEKKLQKLETMKKLIIKIEKIREEKKAADDDFNKDIKEKEAQLLECAQGDDKQFELNLF